MLLTLLLITCGRLTNALDYEPNWESLDSRPLPSWYDSAKIGIFLHWGVFSVPSYTSEWFWWYWKGSSPVKNVVDYMQQNYPPHFEYVQFAKDFKADLFDPEQWARIFQASGARYVVLTTKHHEGFCNWDTKHSFNWNSVDTGPGRDLVKELADAIRNHTDLRFGVYHSLFEWFNPLYLEDAKNNFKTNNFVAQKSMPQLYELVTNYKPDILWSDGDAGPVDYWNSTNFLAWLYNESPVRSAVVTNDRWGEGTACKHGGYYTCADRYNPGHKVNHKWENCFTLDKKSWGYRREATLEDIMSIEEVIFQIVTTISCGGNVLINVGPTSAGTIAPIYEERFRQMGNWLGVNQEAIYNTSPWIHQNDSLTKDVWYTYRNITETGDSDRLNLKSSKEKYVPIVYATLLNPSFSFSSQKIILLNGFTKPFNKISKVQLIVGDQQFVDLEYHFNDDAAVLSVIPLDIILNELSRLALVIKITFEPV